MTGDIASSLHRLRSALATVQSEADLLAMDGVPTERLRRACLESIDRLSNVEKVCLELGAESVRVVMLEDDERLGMAIARQLSRHGIDACVVTTPVSAIRWADTHHALVADLSALEEAADSQIGAIRKLRPIVLTGATLGEAHDRSARFAPRCVLMKPVDIGALALMLTDHRASGGE